MKPHTGIITFNNSSLTVYCRIINSLLKLLNADRDVCCFLSDLYIHYTLIDITRIAKGAKELERARLLTNGVYADDSDGGQ